MDALRNSIILLASLIVTGLGTDVLANDYVAVKARLTDTDQNFTYTVEQKERTFEITAPSATFEIISPESLSGRFVRIFFHEGDLEVFLDESGNKIAEYYFLEILRANTELTGDIEVSDYQINRIQPISDGENR